MRYYLNQSSLSGGPGHVTSNVSKMSLVPSNEVESLIKLINKDKDKNQKLSRVDLEKFFRTPANVNLLINRYTDQRVLATSQQRLSFINSLDEGATALFIKTLLLSKEIRDNKSFNAFVNEIKLYLHIRCTTPKRNEILSELKQTSLHQLLATPPKPLGEVKLDPNKTTTVTQERSGVPGLFDYVVTEKVTRESTASGREEAEGNYPKTTIKSPPHSGAFDYLNTERRLSYLTGHDFDACLLVYKEDPEYYDKAYESRLQKIEKAISSGNVDKLELPPFEELRYFQKGAGGQITLKERNPYLNRSIRLNHRYLIGLLKNYDTYYKIKLALYKEFKDKPAGGYAALRWLTNELKNKNLLPTSDIYNQALWIELLDESIRLEDYKEEPAGNAQPGRSSFDVNFSNMTKVNSKLLTSYNEVLLHVFSNLKTVAAKQAALDGITLEGQHIDWVSFKKNPYIYRDKIDWNKFVELQNAKVDKRKANISGSKKDFGTKNEIDTIANDLHSIENALKKNQPIATLRAQFETVKNRFNAAKQSDIESGFIDERPEWGIESLEKRAKQIEGILKVMEHTIQLRELSLEETKIRESILKAGKGEISMEELGFTINPASEGNVKVYINPVDEFEKNTPTDKQNSKTFIKFCQERKFDLSKPLLRTYNAYLISKEIRPLGYTNIENEDSVSFDFISEAEWNNLANYITGYSPHEKKGKTYSASLLKQMEILYRFNEDYQNLSAGLESFTPEKVQEYANNNTLLPHIKQTIQAYLHDPSKTKLLEKLLPHGKTKTYGNLNGETTSAYGNSKDKTNQKTKDAIDNFSGVLSQKILNTLENLKNKILVDRADLDLNKGRTALAVNIRKYKSGIQNIGKKDFNGIPDGVASLEDKKIYLSLIASDELATDFWNELDSLPEGNASLISQAIINFAKENRANEEISNFIKEINSYFESNKNDKNIKGSLKIFLESKVLLSGKLREKMIKNLYLGTSEQRIQAEKQGIIKKQAKNSAEERAAQQVFLRKTEAYKFINETMMEVSKRLKEAKISKNSQSNRQPGQRNDAANRMQEVLTESTFDKVNDYEKDHEEFTKKLNKLRSYQSLSKGELVRKYDEYRADLKTTVKAYGDLKNKYGTWLIEDKKRYNVLADGYSTEFKADGKEEILGQAENTELTKSSNEVFLALDNQLQIEKEKFSQATDFKVWWEENEKIIKAAKSFTGNGKDVLTDIKDLLKTYTNLNPNQNYDKYLTEAGLSPKNYPKKEWVKSLEKQRDLMVKIIGDELKVIILRNAVEDYRGKMIDVSEENAETKALGTINKNADLQEKIDFIQASQDVNPVGISAYKAAILQKQNELFQTIPVNEPEAVELLKEGSEAISADLHSKTFTLEEVGTYGNYKRKSTDIGATNNQNIADEKTAVGGFIKFKFKNVPGYFTLDISGSKGVQSEEKAVTNQSKTDSSSGTQTTYDSPSYRPESSSLDVGIRHQYYGKLFKSIVTDLRYGYEKSTSISNITVKQATQINTPLGSIGSRTSFNKGVNGILGFTFNSSNNPNISLTSVQMVVTPFTTQARAEDPVTYPANLANSYDPLAPSSAPQTFNAVGNSITFTENFTPPSFSTAYYRETLTFNYLENGVPKTYSSQEVYAFNNSGSSTITRVGPGRWTAPNLLVNQPGENAVVETKTETHRLKLQSEVSVMVSGLLTTLTTGVKYYTQSVKTRLVSAVTSGVLAGMNETEILNYLRNNGLLAPDVNNDAFSFILGLAIQSTNKYLDYQVRGEIELSKYERHSLAEVTLSKQIPVNQKNKLVLALILTGALDSKLQEVDLKTYTYGANLRTSWVWQNPTSFLSAMITYIDVGVSGNADNFFKRSIDLQTTDSQYRREWRYKFGVQFWPTFLGNARFGISGIFGHEGGLDDISKSTLKGVDFMASSRLGGSSSKKANLSEDDKKDIKEYTDNILKIYNGKIAIDFINDKDESISVSALEMGFMGLESDKQKQVLKLLSKIKDVYETLMADSPDVKDNPGKLMRKFERLYELDRKKIDVMNDIRELLVDSGAAGMENLDWHNLPSKAAQIVEWAKRKENNDTVFIGKNKKEKLLAYINNFLEEGIAKNDISKKYTEALLALKSDLSQK